VIAEEVEILIEIFFLFEIEFEFKVEVLVGQPLQYLENIALEYSRLVMIVISIFNVLPRFRIGNVDKVFWHRKHLE
jgi:hypothetical protein